MTIKKAIKRLQGWLTEGYYKINRQDSDWSEDKAALELAIQCMNDMRPKGECRTCRHRDPEDKKCDCGALERHGCPFPVSDDYFCKFYEKGGAPMKRG